MACSPNICEEKVLSICWPIFSGSSKEGHQKARGAIFHRFLVHVSSKSHIQLTGVSPAAAVWYPFGICLVGQEQQALIKELLEDASAASRQLQTYATSAELATQAENFGLEDLGRNDLLTFNINEINDL